jgi:hypothetical protein
MKGIIISILCRSITHSNLKLIKQEQELAMVDHWEWTLTHAQGEWVVFLEADWSNILTDFGTG